MNPVFTTDVAVRWSDQDVNRHVNNARVVTLIEEARLAALAHWLGADGVPDPAQPRVVVSLHLDYLRPVDHGPQLTGRLQVLRVGRTSYTLLCELLQHGQVAARAKTVLVQMDPQTGRAVPLPGPVREVLSRLLVEGGAAGPDDGDGDGGRDGRRPAQAAPAEARRV